ncbi:MerR family transcriptional regulator [Microbacterium sp. X-17]|uniref:MerR family transcriptional regulator n=1 Tax=Microbacterium sp. X-17 TaxID=3144404 RepID=UPI0031F589F5
MRISELSRRAGVAVSTVKYYQREGLIPDGERSAPNQVDYDERHVERVRLIRALLETGGLSVSAATEVIRVLDAEDASLAEAFAVAQHAMAVTGLQAPASGARERVERIARARGWAFTADNPGIDAAARALEGLAAIGFDAPETYLAAYADAAAATARVDLDALAELGDPDRVAELMVVGTVLGDPLFAGLRRIAHQDATHRLFPAAGAPAADPQEDS